MNDYQKFILNRVDVLIKSGFTFDEINQRFNLETLNYLSRYRVPIWFRDGLLVGIPRYKAQPIWDDFKKWVMKYDPFLWDGIGDYLMIFPNPYW